LIKNFIPATFESGFLLVKESIWLA